MLENKYDKDIKILNILATIETIKLELKDLESLIKGLDDYENKKQNN